MPKDYKSPPSDDDLLEWANRMASEPEDVLSLADRQKWIDFVSSEINATDKQIYWLDQARGLMQDELSKSGVHIKEEQFRVRTGWLTTYETRTVIRDDSGHYLSSDKAFDILKDIFYT